MRPLALILLAAVSLAACTPPDATTGDTYQSPRQQPSASEPGVQVSGYGNVGIKRGF